MSNVCRRCDKTWSISTYNFYDLCDDCFELFNQQKMHGRFRMVGLTPQTNDQHTAFYSENVHVWLAHHPAAAKPLIPQK